MPLVSRVRPRLGDVIEIQTSRGLAYAHYSHEHKEPPRYGSLLRVLPGFHQSRPADFSEIVQQPSDFSAFFPLGAACNRKLVTIVANEPIAARHMKFPTFRGRMSTDHPWWLWDGVKSWKVGSLTEKQLAELPPSGVWNDTLLIQRIEQGWRHADDIGPKPPIGV